MIGRIQWIGVAEPLRASGAAHVVLLLEAVVEVWAAAAAAAAAAAVLVLVLVLAQTPQQQHLYHPQMHRRWMEAHSTNCSRHSSGLAATRRDNALSSGEVGALCTETGWRRLLPQ